MLTCLVPHSPSGSASLGVARLRSTGRSITNPSVPVSICKSLNEWRERCWPVRAFSALGPSYKYRYVLRAAAPPRKLAAKRTLAADSKGSLLLQRASLTSATSYCAQACDTRPLARYSALGPTHGPRPVYGYDTRVLWVGVPPSVRSAGYSIADTPACCALVGPLIKCVLHGRPAGEYPQLPLAVRRHALATARGDTV
mgnify:CR=1 FL=1